MENYICELRVLDGVLVSDLLIDQAVADECYIYIGEEQIADDLDDNSYLEGIFYVGIVVGLLLLIDIIVTIMKRN